MIFLTSCDLIRCLNAEQGIVMLMSVSKLKSDRKLRISSQGSSWYFLGVVGPKRPIPSFSVKLIASRSSAMTYVLYC